jgi:hypothetical protein
VILEENGTKPLLEGHERMSYDEEHGDWTGGREKIMLPFDHEAGAAGVFRRWSSGRAAVRCSDHLKHCNCRSPTHVQLHRAGWVGSP